MSAALWAAASCAAAAAGLGVASRPPGASAPRTERDPSDEQGVLRRWRPLLVALLALAAWSFLGGTVGLAGAVAAAVVGWRVLGSTESPAARQRRERLAADLPAAVDLAVAALEAGSAVPDALDLACDALPGPVSDELAPVLRRIRLGADPGEVWAGLAVHEQLGPLGRSLARAHASGASVVDTGRVLAEELRRGRLASREALARSVAIRAAAPMGACYLPAFLLLGIVPLVASLLGSLSLG